MTITMWIVPILNYDMITFFISWNKPFDTSLKLVSIIWDI